MLHRPALLLTLTATLALTGCPTSPEEDDSSNDNDTSGDTDDSDTDDTDTNDSDTNDSDTDDSDTDDSDTDTDDSDTDDTDTDTDTDTGDTDTDTGVSCVGTYTVCDTSVDGLIIDEDGCGDLIAVVGTCDSNEVCVDEDSSGDYKAATCEATCGSDTDHTVCQPDSPDEIYYANACNQVTGVAESCQGSFECDDSDGTPVCGCAPLETTSCALLSSGGDGLYDETAVIYENTCGNNDTSPENTAETCSFGTQCFQETGFFDDEAVCARSITEESADSPYYDHSCSFADWVRYPTDLPIDCRCRQIGDGSTGAGYVNPTTGDRPGNAIVNCRKLGELEPAQWPLDMGSGPSFAPLQSETASGTRYHGGYFDPVTRELFGVGLWTNPQYNRTATVVAYQVDTGARRIVSGLFPDPNQGIVSYGSGYETERPLGVDQSDGPQPLTGATSLRVGPDGLLYVYGSSNGDGSSQKAHIVSVDPTTGHRELVWRGQVQNKLDKGGTGDISAEYGQCLQHGPILSTYGYAKSVAWTNNAFAVDDDGNFYMSFHDGREGDGIGRISADGKQCTIVSRWGARAATGSPAPDNVGTGFLPQNGYVYGLAVKDGAVYGVTSPGGDFLEFNLTTGNRINVGPKPSSGYTGIGYQNIFWDDTRDVWWAVGDHARFVGSIIDPVNGQRESIYGDSTDYPNPILQSNYGVQRSVGQNSMLAQANGIHHGPVALDPNDNDHVWFFVHGGALGHLELSTFNNYIRSY